MNFLRVTHILNYDGVYDPNSRTILPGARDHGVLFIIIPVFFVVVVVVVVVWFYF